MNFANEHVCAFYCENCRKFLRYDIPLDKVIHVPVYTLNVFYSVELLIYSLNVWTICISILHSKYWGLAPLFLRDLRPRPWIPLGASVPKPPNLAITVNKRSAVAEMGDRLATISKGRKWGSCCGGSFPTGSPSNAICLRLRPTCH